MDNIHLILEQLEKSNLKSALATIVRVEGSAYRKEGTTMLIREDGSRVGVLSAGCLEDDLSERARDMIAGAPAEIIVYDLSSEDDLSWGRGAGCNGKVHVLLERVDSVWKEQLLQLRASLNEGKEVTLYRHLGIAEERQRLFVGQDGEAFGTWPEPPAPLLEAARPGAVNAANAVTGIHPFPGVEGCIYVQRFKPKPRLILFGAGSDAEPLSCFAAKTGFDVVISDWRTAMLTHDRFPDAAALWPGDPAEVVPSAEFRASDSVIVMTHDFKRDRELVTLLQEKKPGYLGILGSRQRTSRLLGQEGLPAGVRSPVGMAIGAEGPEEIAISIVADVIRTMRKGPAAGG